MRIMPDIERQRANNDFMYMMLFSCTEEHIATRAWYHREMAARVLHLLGVDPGSPNDVVAVCMRKFVDNALPPLPADTIARGEDVRRKLPETESARIHFAYRTLCTNIDAVFQPPVTIETRKTVQDVLLFFNLLMFPGFLQWLRECDPAACPDDVHVLDPDKLYVFVTRYVSSCFNMSMPGVQPIQDLVMNLRNSYVLHVGTYNPDAPVRAMDALPDIPDDYQMCPE